MPTVSAQPSATIWRGGPQRPIVASSLSGYLSISAVLMAGLAAIAVLSVSTRFNDPDLWFHLRLGQIVWSTHSIPSTDTLSFSAYGHPWTAHEWLAQWSIYGAYHLGGNTG